MLLLPAPACHSYGWVDADAGECIAPAGSTSGPIEQTADGVQDLVDRLVDLAWPKRRA
jgi:hypothetical protein